MTRRTGPVPVEVCVSRGRIRWLFLGWVACLVALAGRVGYLQTVQSEVLRAMAIRQQQDWVELPALRGRIYDRAGRELATNVPAEYAYAIPRAIPDPDAFARQVAPIVGLPAERIRARLGPNRSFAWIARRLPPEVTARLRALRLTGQMGFEPEPQRRYPLGSLAAQVVGFVGIDHQGLSGLEARFDELLRGRPGRAVRVRDAVGREILEGRQVVQAPQNGSDLFLTLDAVVQHVAERELEQSVREHRARSGVAIVMNVGTGEVLALANVPRFDPNWYAAFPPDLWRNRAIADAYEPGSTFKLVVLAAALDAGVITPEATFFCPGFLRAPGGHRIREAHGEIHGTVRPVDIVRLSCNVGAALVAARLTPDDLYRAFLRFGFGRPTGIELPGESPGIVRPPETWSATDPYTAAFGQGIAVTPLQLTAAVAAIANGGVAVRPSIVSLVRSADGRVAKARSSRTGARVLRPEVAQRMLEMMVRTTIDGTGRSAAVEGYTVAGKTGTAQKPGPSGYLPGKYVASFIGVVPASRPQLVILTLLDEPEGAYYGGVVAAPVFQRIARQVLGYLRIPPDGGIDSGIPAAEPPRD